MATKDRLPYTVSVRVPDAYAQQQIFFVLVDEFDRVSFWEREEDAHRKLQTPRTVEYDALYRFDGGNRTAEFIWRRNDHR